MLTFPTLTESPAKGRPNNRSRKSAPKLACHINRHEPRGHRANWDGTHYVSRCEHCAKDIRRMGHGKWVLDSDRWTKPTGLSATAVEPLRGPSQS